MYTKTIVSNKIKVFIIKEVDRRRSSPNVIGIQCYVLMRFLNFKYADRQLKPPRPYTNDLGLFFGNSLL